MKTSTFLSITFLLCSSILFAQVSINNDNSAPDPSAGLDINFNNKGLLPPRLSTSQINSISSPPAGLMVYNTTIRSLCWFNGTSWEYSLNRDGQDCGTVSYGGITYHSVIIGQQCWMTENLDIGVEITNDNEQTNNGILEKYCYDDSPANCSVYGGLYDWAEMVQYYNGATNGASWNPVPTGPVQGICPTGWHLPSNAEWTILTNYLGGESVAGGKIKETGTVHWSSPNTGATNTSGFTALPGGYHNIDAFTYDINTGGTSGPRRRHRRPLAGSGTLTTTKVQCTNQAVTASRTDSRCDACGINSNIRRIDTFIYHFI